MSKGVKIFVIVIGIIALLIVGYSVFGGSTPAASDTGLTSSSGTPALPGGGGAITPAGDASFSTLLSSINGITLDTSIFQNAGYRALRDYPVTLGTAIIGRQNPFAPIGIDGSGGGAQAPAAMQLQTLAPGKILSTSAEFGALVTSASTDPVTVVFQYGTTDTFGSATPPTKVTKNGTALFTATGLTPSTTYYVEAVAVQGSVTATGTIMSFTTTAAGQKR
jgi:hypothetical protein